MQSVFAYLDVGVGSFRGGRLERWVLPHQVRISWCRASESRKMWQDTFPEGPSTQYSRTLVPKTIPLMVFGTRVLKYWVLGASGFANPANVFRIL